jgi:hypothetical protein
MSAHLTATLDADFNLPNARLLPSPPPTLEDVLNGAVEQLEDFLVYAYLNHTGIPEPGIQWCQGAHDILVGVLACVPLTH